MIVTQEELKRFKAFMGFDKPKAKPKRRRGRPKGSKNKKSKWL